MKTIYYVYSDRAGEADFFFDVKFNLLHFWYCNDASYREEYMKPLFKKLGFKVKGLHESDPRVMPIIKETALKFGCYYEE